MRIVFAGTPEFAVPALQALLAAGQTVCAVYTQPDRPAGRGRGLRASPVKEAAVAAGLPLHQPASLKARAEQGRLAELRPDLMVVVAYGLILPLAVLETPRCGCVNIHASLLPRWRGAAPIQRALIAGDERTGVTLMRMDEGLDTGAMISRAATPIEPHDTAQSLHDRLAAMGAALMVDALPALEAGTAAAEAQDDALACYAPKLSKDEARLDWTLPAAALERRVRAFNPWPVAFTTQAGAPLRVWSATVGPDDDASAAPGTVVRAAAAGIDVATASGTLRLLEVQPAGSRRMSAADFLNARRVLGERLGP